MLSWLRPLRNYRDPLLLAVPVILFMPLPIVVRTTEAYCGYIVLLMAVYWCTEVIPLAITSFLPILLFPTFGIMPSKTVSKQYLKDTNVLFLGGLMVAIAIEHWNLHKRIALRALLLVGVKPALLMLGFMAVTAFLSMWISNTATTAMMVPIAKAVLDQLSSTDEAARMELGNSRSSAHEKEVESKSTIPDMELSDVATSSKEANVQQNNLNVSKVPIGSHDQHEKDMHKGLTLCICYAASIGGTATLTGTGPNLVLKGQMNQLFPDNGDVINFASWFGFAFPNMLIMLFLCWLWLQALFLGLNFRRLWGCGIPISSKEKRAYGVIQEEYKKLGPMGFAEKAVLILFVLLVVLWFTRDPGFVPGWGNVLFNKNGQEYVTDATVVLFIAFLMFIVPSQKPKFKPWNRLKGSKKRISDKKQVKKLLDWNTVQHKLPWNVVLLLGGGFALAKGCEVSGLSQWLGNQLLPLQKIPHWAIAVILCVVIAVFTECTSNVATATLFLPILASMATMIRMNPLYVMIPTTLSTSFAFMLPVATPPNAIVFSYGHLRVLDMVRAGSFINIIGVASVTLAINTWGYAIFNLNTFPEWANVTRRV
ncbi:solute carrier family 13 member 5-like isoform X1 [Carcharodon carcharias]|uniref:solute carrier family 13 member 5-like isoform X1 n=1 Tax=Carcharodon carcharias TaxID=13397 RepID=UPI001B7ECA0C|nr:solute carrier family 13 member 5-like isoform X1 [Carcharodon carcharias]